MNEQVHSLKLEVARGKENEDNLLKINGVPPHKPRSCGIKWSPYRPSWPCPPRISEISWTSP